MKRFTNLPAVDVHQHLWPEPLLDALRRRTAAPRLRGWTLELAGEPPFTVDPAAHDVGRRARQLEADGLAVAVVALSAALGVHALAPEESRELVDAYHAGVLALPAPFRAWASATLSEVDAAGLTVLLARGVVGLELPATALLDRAGYERVAPLLAVLERSGRPLFIHPGPAAVPPGSPSWWSALVDYPTQMHAAWHAFGAYGRPAHPQLRVVFALLAGLGPLHGERARSRAGLRGVVDDRVFVETSSYGSRAIDATVRVLGVDALVGGSDRPYAEPADPGLGEAFTHSLWRRNPARLIDHPEVSDGLAVGC